MSVAFRNDCAWSRGAALQQSTGYFREMPVPDYTETLAFPISVNININNKHVMKRSHGKYGSTRMGSSNLRHDASP